MRLSNRFWNMLWFWNTLNVTHCEENETKGKDILLRTTLKRWKSMICFLTMRRNLALKILRKCSIISLGLVPTTPPPFCSIQYSTCILPLVFHCCFLPPPPQLQHRSLSSTQALVVYIRLCRHKFEPQN